MWLFLTIFHWNFVAFDLFALRLGVILGLHFSFSPFKTFWAIFFHFFWKFWYYSLHQKKGYTCGKAKYSRTRVTRGKEGGVPHPQLSWSKVDFLSGPPHILSTWLDKSVYFLLGETVWRFPDITDEMSVQTLRVHYIVSQDSTL